MNKYLMWFYRNVILGKDICNFIDNNPNIPVIRISERGGITVIKDTMCRCDK